MKTQYHFFIALGCFIMLAYHYIYSFEIITHPYMFLLMMGLFSVGGWNFGVGVAKLVKELK
jgi:hypothetical protein